MDDFDDLDSLLDLEYNLLRSEDAEHEPTEGSAKRILGEANGERTSPAKRPRNEIENDRTKPVQDINSQLAGALADDDGVDDELLDLAAQAYASQFPTTLLEQSGVDARPENNNNDDNEAEMDEVEGEEELPPQQQSPEASIFRPYVPPARNVIDIQGKCVAVTGPDGERVYCHVDTADKDTESAAAAALRAPKAGLLSASIQDLIRAVEKDMFDRALAAVPDESNVDGTTKDSQREGGSGEKKEGVSGLWVDHYAPQTFMDLLGNEQINREVVHWLKSWNPCVFGTPAPAPTTTNHRHSNYNNKNSTYNKGKPFNHASATTPDALGRPEHKVILLCGPPGIGKTTLAHVVARHCGYRPYEINASDDRNANALMARIRNAAEMTSVLGERRPNCIILDEIDGVANGGEGRGAIAALVKLITASGGGSKNRNDNSSNAKKETKLLGLKATPEKGGDDSEDEEDASGETHQGRNGGSKNVNLSSGKKKKKGERPLMRPLICICNDPYAPALRPLRDIARVLHFKKPLPERLVHRLQAVCSSEGLRAEKSTLRMLADRTDCDIRSCLNTLQFLAKKQTVVRQADLAGLNVGQKDVTKGAFQVWGELFQPKKAAARPGMGRNGLASPTGGFVAKYAMLQDFGEEDLVLNGIHENLPNAAVFMDTTLQRTSQVLTLLQQADHMMKYARSYVPAVVLSMSSIVAGQGGHERKQLSWPRTGAEANRRAAYNTSLVQQWMLGMNPHCFAALGKAAAVQEVLPSLPRLTGPALRPVSLHLFSKEEKVAVEALVDTLLTLGLNFSLIDDTQDDRQTIIAGREPRELPLILRPPVHRLWLFEDRQPPVKVLAPALRQLLAHEVDLEGIRRAEEHRRRLADALPSSGEQAMDVDKPEQAPNAISQPLQTIAGPVQLDLAQRLREAGKNKIIARKEETGGTWLDKLRDSRASAGSSKLLQQREAAAKEREVKVQLTVLYKYHEGFTNAVKRPTLMSELL